MLENSASPSKSVHKREMKRQRKEEDLEIRLAKEEKEERLAAQVSEWKEQSERQYKQNAVANENNLIDKARMKSVKLKKSKMEASRDQVWIPLKSDQDNAVDVPGMWPRKLHILSCNKQQLEFDQPGLSDFRDEKKNLGLKNENFNIKPVSIASAEPFISTGGSHFQLAATLKDPMEGNPTVEFSKLMKNFQDFLNTSADGKILNTSAEGKILPSFANEIVQNVSYILASNCQGVENFTLHSLKRLCNIDESGSSINISPHESSGGVHIFKRYLRNTIFFMRYCLRPSSNIVPAVLSNREVLYYIKDLKRMVKGLCQESSPVANCVSQGFHVQSNLFTLEEIQNLLSNQNVIQIMDLLRHTTARTASQLSHSEASSMKNILLMYSVVKFICSSQEITNITVDDILNAKKVVEPFFSVVVEKHQPQSLNQAYILNMTKHELKSYRRYAKHIRPLMIKLYNASAKVAKEARQDDTDNVAVTSMFPTASTTTKTNSQCFLFSNDNGTKMELGSMRKILRSTFKSLFPVSQKKFSSHTMRKSMTTILERLNFADGEVRNELQPTWLLLLKVTDHSKSESTQSYNLTTHISQTAEGQILINKVFADEIPSLTGYECASSVIVGADSTLCSPHKQEKKYLKRERRLHLEKEEHVRQASYGSEAILVSPTLPMSGIASNESEAPLLCSTLPMSGIASNGSKAILVSSTSPMSGIASNESEANLLSSTPLMSGISRNESEALFLSSTLSMPEIAASPFKSAQRRKREELQNQMEGEEEMIAKKAEQTRQKNYQLEFDHLIQMASDKKKLIAKSLSVSPKWKMAKMVGTQCQGQLLSKKSDQESDVEYLGIHPSMLPNLSLTQGKGDLPYTFKSFNESSSSESLPSFKRKHVINQLGSTIEKKKICSGASLKKIYSDTDEDSDNTFKEDKDFPSEYKRYWKEKGHRLLASENVKEGPVALYLQKRQRSCSPSYSNPAVAHQGKENVEENRESQLCKLKENYPILDPFKNSSEITKFLPLNPINTLNPRLNPHLGFNNYQTKCFSSTADPKQATHSRVFGTNMTKVHNLQTTSKINKFQCPKCPKTVVRLDLHLIRFHKLKKNTLMFSKAMAAGQKKSVKAAASGKFQRRKLASTRAVASIGRVPVYHSQQPTTTLNNTIEGAPTVAGAEGSRQGITGKLLSDEMNNSLSTSPLPNDLTTLVRKTVEGQFQLNKVLADNIPFLVGSNAGVSSCIDNKIQSISTALPKEKAQSMLGFPKSSVPSLQKIDNARLLKCPNCPAMISRLDLHLVKMHKFQRGTPEFLSAMAAGRRCTANPTENRNNKPDDFMDIIRQTLEGQIVINKVLLGEIFFSEAAHFREGESGSPHTEDINQGSSGIKESQEMERLKYMKAKADETISFPAHLPPLQVASKAPIINVNWNTTVATPTASTSATPTSASTVATLISSSTSATPTSASTVATFTSASTVSKGSSALNATLSALYAANPLLGKIVN